MSTRRSKRTILIAGAVVILAGFSYLIYGGIGSNLVYFVTPGELMAKGSQAYEKPVRLGGMVVPGTVVWNAEAIDLRFTMTDGKGTTKTVHSLTAAPQKINERQSVEVESRLSRDGAFQATNLMVKHSNEYKKPADHAADPRVIDKRLIRQAGN